MSVTAILAAAGRGTRLGQRKQLLALAGKPIVAWSLAALGDCARVDAIVISSEDDERDRFERIAREYGQGKVRAVVAGGARRQDSVLAALRRVPPDTRFVIVHDGARPFVEVELIERCLAKAEETGAAIAAIPVTDTIKRVGDGSVIAVTPPREQLWAAQTPQAFAYSILLEAHERALQDGFLGTDDAMLVEWAGLCPVTVIEGSRDNIKITTTEDLALAEHIAARATSVRS